MNVRPRNYGWRAFYEHVIDLTRYSFGSKAMFRRFRATRGMTSRWLNLLRTVSSEGFGRLKYYKEIRARLHTDPQFAPYFEQETDELPEFYTDLARRDLVVMGLASGWRSEP